MLIILAVHQGLERYLFSMLPGLGSLQYLTLVGRERSGKEFELILAGNYLSNSLPPQLVSLIFLDDTPTPLSLYNLAINLKPTHFHFVHWPNHDQPSFSITKQAFLSMGVSVVPFVKVCCEPNVLEMNEERSLIWPLTDWKKKNNADACKSKELKSVSNYCFTIVNERDWEWSTTTYYWAKEMRDTSRGVV